MRPDFSLLFLLVLQLTFHISTQANSCPERQPQTGRECQKACHPNDNPCKSPRKSCECDGQCGYSCINQNHRCEQLEKTILNGRVVIKPQNMFGGIATYECDWGYEIRGQKVRVCQGDGFWGGETPECVLSKGSDKEGCGSPPEIDFATHNGRQLGPGERYPSGTMLQYTCIKDYMKNPDNVERAWCIVGGEWVGPKMTCQAAGCPKPPKPLNGGVVVPASTGVNSVVQYYCDQGFHLTGRSERTCRSDSTWDGDEPRCEKGGSATCGPPPYVDRAFHDSNDVERFSVGTQIQYRCQDGFMLADRYANTRAECMRDERWEGPRMSCTPVNCGFPYTVENGRIEGIDFTFPHSVKFVCNEGYKLMGNETTTCQANGQWSSESPSCAAEIDCGWPKNFWNGYVLGEKTTLGSTLFFSCIVRTTFDGPYFETKCLSNGRWSNPPPTCWGQCTIPNIDNAEVVGYPVGTWVNHGKTFEYDCKNGLVPIRSRMVTCYNGTFNPSTPKCVPAPCPSPPPLVENGIRLFIGQEHGRRARYICANGFRLMGMGQNMPYLICDKGKWIGGNPVCEEHFCQNPGAISNGKIFKKEPNNLRFNFPQYITTIKHGQRLEFKCDPGYEISGASGATCINGQWIPPLGGADSHCKPQQYLKLPILWKPLPNRNFHET
ncbi:sushi, von Willebrand factor type A, EGF and pentraxin domain-containing protein 1-like isoform X5 [Ostrea edulis]|uniref:sushi, von Willebrand factor type A, EGF and pentraxin domain-containing protein 1-like isoform X5 n=1 Tax=Ostrea edulis TaxID=37623 RepID=UPI0024AEA167|nr:sushi, von Willebrand factor type A, EGF and pentraxin domain-containing protein 1-like isoform X5 [Ostrea edulis]